VVAAVTISFKLPRQFLDVRPQRHGFTLVAAFFLSFLFIRTSARLMRSPKVPWWPGSVTTESGLHIQSTEGRSSLDAVIVATLIACLVVLGFAPFDASESTPAESLRLLVAIDALLCVAVILKGRPLVALIGAFIPPVSFAVALRLATPTSLWARRFYKPGSAKLARSKARFARMRARNRRLLDLIGGRPFAGQTMAAIDGPDDRGQA
jgi:hypothetical protein